MLVTLAAGDNPLSHVLPHTVFNVPIFGDVSNHLMMASISACLVAVLALWMRGRLDPTGKVTADDFVIRGKFAQLLETLAEFVRDFIARPQLKHLTDRYIPYIWTIFFFILTCNLIGLIPFGYFFKSIGMLVGLEKSTTEWLGHLGGTATSNLSLNVPLAVISFIAVIYIGIKETGVKHFVGHFNPIGWQDKKLAPIGGMLFVLEWLGLVIKCTVLAFRLFGTMLAGHLVLAVLVGLIGDAFAGLGTAAGFGVALPMVVISVAMMMLEIFVAFLQAFIFTFLTTIFIAMTAVTHGGHEHDQPHEHARDDHDPSINEAVTAPLAH